MSVGKLLFLSGLTNDMEATFIFHTFRRPAEAFLDQYYAPAEYDRQNKEKDHAPF
ncbi:MAG: hypothetical protein ABJB22_01970 [Verrucomicrobiota bacterium]